MLLIASRLSNNTTLASIVWVSVMQKGINHKCRALLDNGAQSNFITEHLVNILNLNRNPTFIQISGVNKSESIVKHSVNATLSSCTEYYSRNIECLVIKQITRDLPMHHIDISNWDIPHDTILADPSFNVTSKIDLLLAADTFYDVVKGGIIPLPNCDELKLFEMRFGWVVGVLLSIQSLLIRLFTHVFGMTVSISMICINQFKSSGTLKQLLMIAFCLQKRRLLRNILLPLSKGILMVDISLLFP